MLGRLPQTVNVLNHSYKIRSDFRDILTIISAYNDDSLSDNEKVFVCLKRFYVDFSDMPKDKDTYTAALEAAHKFIECKLSSDKAGPQVINWEKDEQMIFPAVNKIAGMEVRTVSYMHWWTFLGYFMAVDRDDLWGTVLTVRQKRALGKKLEPYEKDFLKSNHDLCALEFDGKRQTPEDALEELYQKLLLEGGGKNE